MMMAPSTPAPTRSKLRTACDAGLIVSAKVRIAGVVPTLSLTVAMIVTFPAAVGVPVRTPVLALSVSPGGSPVAVQLYGPVPPVAVRVCV